MPQVACNHVLEYVFEPATTAFLAIDMQRDFLDPGGYLAAAGDDVSGLAAIIPRFARVMAAARARVMATVVVAVHRAGMLPVHIDLLYEITHLR